MVSNPEMFLKEFSDYCEIESITSEIPWIHSQYEYRFPSIARVYRNPPKILIPLKKQFKKRSIGNYITKTFTYFNEKKSDINKNVSEKTLRKLKNHCINNLKNIPEYVNLPDDWLI